MTQLREKIGRLLVVGIPGKSLDDATRRTLEELHVGGVILFRRNVGGPDEVEALTAAVHALPSQPLVSIDQEGGRVMRLGEPFTQMPAAASVGNTTDAELAYRVGFAMAEELAAVGIDADLAPVLDVNSNPENPVIGDRAYSSSPQMVAEMGIAVMCGLIAGGVVPCGKHFPGHGDTVTDSHFDLPVVRRGREELERTELLPFRAAVAAGMPMLMTAHVLYPALDPVWPATLSRAVLTDLLRRELRFDGVVASDDLEMGAITGKQDIADAAVRALDAGVDWLLVCQDLANAVRVRDAVAAACSQGTLSADLLTVAGERVQRLQEFRRSVRRLACPLPNAPHRALLREITARQG
jgi:beta-N-acetylhexosaminidase